MIDFVLVEEEAALWMVRNYCQHQQEIKVVHMDMIQICGTRPVLIIK